MRTRWIAHLNRLEPLYDEWLVVVSENRFIKRRLRVVIRDDGDIKSILEILVIGNWPYYLIPGYPIIYIR